MGVLFISLHNSLTTITTLKTEEQHRSAPVVTGLLQSPRSASQPPASDVGQLSDASTMRNFTRTAWSFATVLSLALSSRATLLEASQNALGAASLQDSLAAQSRGHDARCKTAFPTPVQWSFSTTPIQPGLGSASGNPEAGSAVRSLRFPFAPRNPFGTHAGNGLAFHRALTPVDSPGLTLASWCVADTAQVTLAAAPLRRRLLADPLCSLMWCSSGCLHQPRTHPSTHALVSIATSDGRGTTARSARGRQSDGQGRSGPGLHLDS